MDLNQGNYSKNYNLVKINLKLCKIKHNSLMTVATKFKCQHSPDMGFIEQPHKIYIY